MKLTKHHRRPKSRGGKNVPKNISWVTRIKHESWHILFDNFSVPKICCLLGYYFNLFTKTTSEYDERINMWLIGTNKKHVESRLRKHQAWEILFSDMPLEEVINEVNEIWIDPAYVLIVTHEIKFMKAKIE